MEMNETLNKTTIYEKLNAWIGAPIEDGDTFDCLGEEEWKVANEIFPVDTTTVYLLQTEQVRDGLSGIGLRYPTTNPAIFYDFHYKNSQVGEKRLTLTRRHLRKISIDPTI